MAASGFKFLFLIFNFVYWAVGAGLIGLVSWTLVTIPNASGFLSGSFVLSYACIAIGLIILVAGILGCIGGLTESLCLLKTYVGVMTAMVFIEIGLIIALYAVQTEIPKLIESTWDQINTDTRYEIQKELECCGIQNYTEYSTEITELPDSCFKIYNTLTIVTKSESTLFTSSCLTKMQDWLNNNMPIWISVLVAIVIIQLVSSMFSCLVLSKLHNSPKTKVAPTPEPEAEIEDNETASYHEPSTSSTVLPPTVMTVYDNPEQV